MSKLSSVNDDVFFITAGNPDCKPHIYRAEAKQLNMRLQELQWDSLTLCEKMYGDKVKAKTVQLWSFAPLDKQPVIYQHSQILLNQDSKKGKQRQYIIPWDEWVPVLESAYDLVDKEASTSYQKPASTAQLVQRTIAMLEQHDIAVNERQLGISPTYVAAYVGLRQQHSNEIRSSNNTVLQASSQHEKVPKLSDNEAEVHFIYKPAVETTSPLIHGDEQISIPMNSDPCPAEQVQTARFIAIVRMPQRQWVQYEYETGMHCLAQEAVCKLL